MISRAAVLAVAGVLATAGTSLARGQTVAGSPEPIPRFALDLRGASAGLPTSEGWTPTVPSSTEVPSRGLAAEAGAHLYLARLKFGALGLGATVIVARGRISNQTAAPTTPTPAIVLPEVTTRFTGIVPQLSFNFGHRLGWSYLSAGLGRTRVTSSATVGAKAAIVEQDWTKTLNYGGGARWFVTDHLGVIFDLRWHKISIVEATSTNPGAPRASLFVAGVGITFK
jgi:opacity protein-like surface antigen